MIKKPQLFNDSLESYDGFDEQKSHSRHQKNHTSRHHRKNDRINLLNSVPTSTNRSIPKEIDPAIDKTDDDLKISVTEDAVSEDVTLNFSTTSKSKKTNRKQKLVSENEEDRSQKRRKNHHHFRNVVRNNTLLTNSVHDEILGVNFTESANSVHRHHHQRQDKNNVNRGTESSLEKEDKKNNVESNEPLSGFIEAAVTETMKNFSENTESSIISSKKHKSQMLSLDSHNRKRKPSEFSIVMPSIIVC